MFENFYTIIIIIGVTSLTVVLYYNKILQNLLKVLTSLLQLQENREENLEAFISSIEQQLKQLGIQEIQYEITYLHKKIDSHTSLKDGTLLLKKNIHDKKISGELSIVVQNNSGEYKIINKLILYVLTLQILNAIHADIEKINESFERIAKLQTYMMHDLKNILQFFQAMQYNIENIHTQEEQERFIHFLQNSTQPINTKVNKILALLQVQSRLNTTKEKKKLQLSSIITKYALQYKLSCQIQGEATLFINEEHINTIVENILLNIAQKEKNVTIQAIVTIEETQESISLTFEDNGEPFENPKEVLQAFYTTKKEGLGIGMYQVASTVESLRGEIECSNIANKATTHISLPKV